MIIHLLTLPLLLLLSNTIHAHDEFTTDDCLSMHNELRQRHEETEDLVYSTQLETIAKEYVQQLVTNDNSIDVRPTRILPKRRRRHAPDIDPNVHLEMWDGEILFPDGAWDRNKHREVRIGESIHKFCCNSQPHCPKRFFHDIKFPPSAEDVVNDWYEQEINNYDFETGTQKTSTSDMSHFANVVWRKTKAVGCAQSAIVNNCVFTVAIYEEEGGIGSEQDFKENIKPLKGDSKLVIIFLVVIIVVIIITILLLCYFCRGNIKWKYLQWKIKTDTMKSEQELETDSTSWWWLRLFRKRKTQTRSTVARPKASAPCVSIRDNPPTIEMIPNRAPSRSLRRPPAPNKQLSQEDAARLAYRYKGISKKAPSGVSKNDYRDGNRDSNVRDLNRQPSLSGKPPPPPVPSARGPPPSQAPPRNALPRGGQPPKPAPRTSSGRPPSAAPPTPSESTPPSVRDRRAVLENIHKEQTPPPPVARRPMVPPKIQPPPHA